MSIKRDNKGRFVKGNVPWSKTHEYSAESRKKMSESHKDIQNGKDHPMYGKQHTLESRKKISLSHTGIKLSEKQREKFKGRIPWNKKYTVDEYKKSKIEHTKRYFAKIGSVVGLSGKEFAIRISQWTKSIKSRDAHICQVCQSPATVAHHILHKSKYPALSLNINNGIALCKPCHAECHGWKNIVKNS